jgi:hypothetical protein
LGGVLSIKSSFQRASVYAAIFTSVVVAVISLMPISLELKVLGLLIFGSYVFTYLWVSDKTETILQEIRTKGSRVERRCHNIEVINQEEENGICKITVRCRVGMMSKNGCPPNCPKFERPVPTGTGAVGGAVIGGIIGTVFLPALGTVLGGLLGAIFGHAIEDAGLRSQLEIKIDECKANNKIPHIYYLL